MTRDGVADPFAEGTRRARRSPPSAAVAAKHPALCRLERRGRPRHGCWVGRRTVWRLDFCYSDERGGPPVRPGSSESAEWLADLNLVPMLCAGAGRSHVRVGGGSPRCSRQAVRERRLGRSLCSVRRRRTYDRVGDKAIPGTHGLSISAGPGAGRGEATGAVVHHSVTAPGGSQKDGAVAAALLLGHLEAGARPRPAETIEDRPKRLLQVARADAPRSARAGVMANPEATMSRPCRAIRPLERGRLVPKPGLRRIRSRRGEDLSRVRPCGGRGVTTRARVRAIAARSSESRLADTVRQSITPDARRR
jgi:hypothetical protein